MTTTRKSLDFLSPEQIKPFKKINNLLNQSVLAWVMYNDSRENVEDTSNIYDEKAEKIAQAEAKKRGYTVKFSYPGLYPTFEITNANNGKEYTEYNTEGFFKRINGFWD